MSENEKTLSGTDAGAQRRNHSIETMVDNMPGMIYQSLNNPPHYSTIFVSKGSYDLLGYTPEELIGNDEFNYSDHVHPEDKEYFEKRCAETLNVGLPLDITYRIITRDGTVKWIWERSRVLEKNPDGTVYSTEGYYTDITAQQRPESPIASKKDNASDADKISLIKNIFQRYKARFMAYGDESVRDTFKGESIYESGKFFLVAFISLFAWLPYIPTDSVVHQFSQYIVFLRIGLTMVGIVSIALRFTKKFRYRPDIILKICIGYLLIATAIITGTSGEYAPSYIGGFIFVLLLPIVAPFSIVYKSIVTLASIAIFLVAGALTGINFSGAYMIYSKTDLFTVVIVSLSLSYVQQNLRLRTWQQKQQLKEKVEQEHRHMILMSELAQAAGDANKAKTNFLATMSHEIRTPMNAIIGVSQSEMLDKSAADKQIQAFARIYNSGIGLLSIINDILDMSKIETGKMELYPINYDVPSLIHDAVQINTVRIGSKPIKFIVDADENLPSSLVGDELRVKQIMNNLLSNAIKYTDEGYVKLSVKTISGSQTLDSQALSEGQDVMLQIIVEDTGHGMKPEDCEKLFTEYTRFDTDVNRTIEGTGIGLNITKSLVTFMNGNIEVESEYGKGSIFTVVIMQTAVECEPIGADVSKRLSSFSFTGENQLYPLKVNRKPMPHGKVLVVDDVESNLYVAEELMSPYKLKIETVASGFDAIKKVENGETYDIIFMDHMMPIMDGIQTTKKLRDMGYNDIIVALTANALVGNAEMFKQNGFDDFVAKPINVRELDNVLNKYIAATQDTQSEQDTQDAAPLSTKNPKLLEIFCRDAKKAVVTLKETTANDDIKLFTTTAHAMRSALINIGETRAAKLAESLENAAIKGDNRFISDNTESFISELEKLIKTLQPENDQSPGNESNDKITEDIDFLKEQLLIIKTACQNYDEKTAYTALDRLAEKIRHSETTEALEEIRDLLFLQSDFEEATKMVEAQLWLINR